MNVEEEKKTLALYRIQQAEESLDEAQYLFYGDKSPRSVINRTYYSMFYSILALLIFEPYSSSKHSGVLSYFNRHFIKNGRISKDIGRAVNHYSPQSTPRSQSIFDLSLSTLWAL